MVSVVSATELAATALAVVAVVALPDNAPSNVVATIVPAVPDITSDVLVASGINVNLPVLLSNPKNPTLAEPSLYANSIPRSLPSFVAGVLVVSPIWNIGS